MYFVFFIFALFTRNLVATGSRQRLEKNIHNIGTHRQKPVKNWNMAHKDLHIPPELLDQIFVHLEHDSGDDMIWDPFPERAHPREFTPQSSLHPLLLVCKEWYRVAQRRLYRSVGISGRLRSGGGERSTLWAFHKTARANPHLADLVRRLYLDTPIVQKPTEVAPLHVILLALCRNIESLNISGAQQLFTEQLKNVLPALNLVELSLSGFDSHFCSKSKFMLLLSDWPRLQRLSTFGPIFLHDVTINILPSPSTLSGRCPDLQDISIDDECLDANLLLALSEIAPHVKKANIWFEGGREWSTPILTKLGLNTHSFSLEHLRSKLYRRDLLRLSTLAHIARALVQHTSGCARWEFPSLGVAGVHHQYPNA